jgi:hypothetical protein
MMMRYLGLGVGHLNEANFRHEIHALDTVNIPNAFIQDTDMDENGSEPDVNSGDDDSGDEDQGEEEEDGLECEF